MMIAEPKATALRRRPATSSNLRVGQRVLLEAVGEDDSVGVAGQAGEAKHQASVGDLLAEFDRFRGSGGLSDRTLLG